MLNNMPKSVFNGLAALTFAIPIVAWSGLAVHNVRSSVMAYFSESSPGQSINHTLLSGRATFSWQQNTLQGFGNVNMKTADAKAGSSNEFELRMVRVTSSDATSVQGEWDVFKNGNPTCAGCKGAFYVTSPGQYDYVKGYVSNDKVSYTFGGELDPGTRFSY